MERVAVIYDVGGGHPDRDPHRPARRRGAGVRPVSVAEGTCQAVGRRARVATFEEVAALEPRDVVTFRLSRKYLQRSILNAHGMGFTATAVVTNVQSAVAAANSVELPAVLKPNRGFGGTDKYFVEPCRR